MAHELRTPMNAITGFSQLLQTNPKEPLTKTQDEYINIVLQSSNHLLDLINQILNLAKLQSGTLKADLERVNPRKTIDECIDIVEFLARKRNITLHYACDGMTGPNALADRARLKQVVLNLASNAIKYNRENGTVRFLCEVAENPNMFKISVIDTGVGIQAEHLGELFEPFNRLDHETDAIEGTGIGLAITRDLVQMMGGTINVESEVNVGTTFWIEIPLDPSDTQTPEPCAMRDTCNHWGHTS
jgi:signal transduction histidine kinase